MRRSAADGGRADYGFPDLKREPDGGGAFLSRGRSGQDEDPYSSESELHGVRGYAPSRMHVAGVQGTNAGLTSGEVRQPGTICVLGERGLDFSIDVSQIGKQWMHYFMLQPGATVQDALLTLAWKAFDEDRHSFEASHSKALGRILRKAGRETSFAYLGSHGNGHNAEARASKVILEEVKPWLVNLHDDVESFFVRRANRQIKQEPWDQLDPRDLLELQQWNRFIVAHKVSRIDEVTRLSIRQQIAFGIEEGLSIDKIAKLIRNATMFSRKRAVRIARTEVIAASNAANHFAVKRNVDTTKLDRVWLSTRDKRTRPTHVEADGQKRDWNEPYEVGDSKLMFPGDVTLGAEAGEVINCRCTEIFQKKKR